MIGSCSRCGNYARDKIISGCEATCPKCGSKWTFRKGPVYILTGCSGVGKTTTGEAIQKMTDSFVVLDADMFYSLMRPRADEEYMEMVEQVLSLTKNINQAGKNVVWTMAGNIDKLSKTYGARFFSKIAVLALTVGEGELVRRMRQGRGIEDEGWIRSSVEYNEYFRTHDHIGDVAFERLDCDGLAPEQVAQRVLAWLAKEQAAETA